MLKTYDHTTVYDRVNDDDHTGCQKNRRTAEIRERNLKRQDPAIDHRQHSQQCYECNRKPVHDIHDTHDANYNQCDSCMIHAILSLQSVSFHSSWIIFILTRLCPKIKIACLPLILPYLSRRSLIIENHGVIHIFRCKINLILIFHQQH